MACVDSGKFVVEIVSTETGSASDETCPTKLCSGRRVVWYFKLTYHSS